MTELGKEIKKALNYMNTWSGYCAYDVGPALKELETLLNVVGQELPTDSAILDLMPEGGWDE